MTVFSLLVYSCITINAPLTGELMQKTCNWNGGQALYMTEDLCKAAAPAIGSPVFSDVADGRKIEGIRCQPVQVFH